MASSDNGTNEKSIDFEDEDYDPDVEVRLYAEIYYSSETYLPDNETPILNDKLTLHVAQNTETCLSSIKSNVSNENATDGSLTLVNTGNQFPNDNFVEDSTPDNETSEHENLDVRPFYYSKSDWVFGKVSQITRDYEAIEPQLINVNCTGRKERQLTQKGLWLTLENTGRKGSRNKEPNVTLGYKKVPTVYSSAHDPNTVSQSSTNQGNDLTFNDSCIQNNNRKKGKLKIKKKNVSKRACDKKIFPQYVSVDDAGITIQTDKYKIVSKKKKMKKKRNAVPLVISSDSDDSIMEVPVPPKPLPLIIQLPDSEDDSVSSTGDGSKKTNESPAKNKNGSVSLYNLHMDPLTSKAFSKSLDTESIPSAMHEIFNDAMHTARDKSDISVESMCPDGNTLILNCTEIQRTASSLDEIRHMRETGLSTNTQSDDSMTESEATNWLNIAARQSDTTRSRDNCSFGLPNEEVNIAAKQMDNVEQDQQICFVDLSNEKVNIELYNQTRNENSVSANVSTQISYTSDSTSTINSIIANKEKTLTTSIINKEVPGIRKRQTEAVSKPFTDFEVPGIPRKRSKRLRDKAMSGYFFKPMSNELQAFYNNPWGGENMNLHEIQSKMSDNPRCWGILDADLQGPTSKRRRPCPHCNTDSHVGRRCPFKAKVVCCYMCGTKGHTESRCPHTMCLTCGRKYATYRPTCDYCCKLYCDICNGAGHRNNSCPDLWRRYHNTTTETIPIVPRDPSNIMKAPQLLSCCNCGKRGHDVTTCQQLRWSQHFPTPMFVSSYTEGPFYASSSPEQTQYAPSDSQQLHYANKSSNGQRMQYESSNGQQMQYQSSNGQQMQYSSSNKEQIQYTLPNADWIHDLPRNERIGHPNPNNASFYVPPHRGQSRDTIPSKDIKVLKIYDGPETSIIESMYSVPSINVIFQSGGTFQPAAPCLPNASWRLDKLKNMHLDGLLNGRLKPMFLLTWNKNFEFIIRITRESNNIVRMTIQADSTMFHGLEKVMMQWLMRPDDEKSNLEYDIFPYDNVDEMIEILRNKTVLLKTVLAPTSLWEKIIRGEKSLEQLRAKYNHYTNQKKARKRYEKNEKGIIVNMLKRRRLLVTSLYTHSWVDGGREVVGFFTDAAHKLVTTKNLSVHQYLDLIYLNNELFTFHTSEALSKALGKAILEFQRSGSTVPPAAKKQSVDASDEKPPESCMEPAANNAVCERKGTTVTFPHQPMIKNNGLSDDCSPPTPHHERKINIVEDIDPQTNLQSAKVFGTTGAWSTMSPNSIGGAGTDSHTVWNPLFRAASVKAVDPKNAEQTPSAIQRKISKSGGSQKTGNTKGLLRLLTKRNRKRYKTLTRQTIKEANLTNIPHLQKMAKALKLKLGNGSITTDDVDMLKAAIGPKRSDRFIQRHCGSLKNNDNVYQKFLKSL